MDFVPSHSEHFRQHSLDQMVANHRPFGDFTSLRGQANVPFFLNGDKPIFLKPLQGKRYRGSGHGEPMGKRSRYHGLPLSLCFRDCLQIVFFRDRDNRGVRNSTKCVQSNTSTSDVRVRAADAWTYSNLEVKPTQVRATWRVAYNLKMRAPASYLLEPVRATGLRTGSLARMCSFVA